jgi:Ca2+-binding EF-hand superfamily protein
LANVIFSEYDADKSGFIEKNEIKQLLIDLSNEIGIDTPADKDVVEVMTRFDVNKDTKLSKEEFLNFAVELFGDIAAQ